MPVVDALTQALRAAPELNTAPSVALGIAQSSAQDPNADPAGTAQAVAYTGNQAAQQQAFDQQGQKVGHPNLLHQALGWVGRGLHDVTSLPVVSQALHIANAPIQQIQHAYRYEHDVEARHGPIAALLEGVGIAAGAGLGAWAGGSEGAVLGGEAAALIEGQVAYRDSWARTTSGADYQGHYDRQTGEYSGPAGDVSVGRDLASGLKYGSKPQTLTSGITDGLADLFLDPLAAAGKLSSLSRSAEGAGGLIGTARSLAPQGDSLAIRASDLETRVANLPSVDRAFGDIAGMTSPTQIANAYPKFAPLAVQLADAGSKDAVTDVFRNALMAKEMTTEVLPSMSFTRVPFAQVSRAIRSYDGTGSGMIRSVTSLLPTYFDPETLSLSNKEFNLGDPGAIRGVYNVMRFSQSDEVARSVADEFARAADDPGKQLLIYKNGIRSMLVAKGLPEDSPFVTAAVDEIGQRAMGGGEAVYGVDQTGRNLSKVETANGSSSLAILAGQQGKLAFPDFSAVTREARNLSTFKSYYGAADDWMYNKFTQGIFKKLVLLSGGFAERIAAAEAIPAALREGVTNLVKSRLAASAAKGMGDEELGHLAEAVSKVSGGANAVLGDADKTGFVANLIADNGGHVVAPAIDTTTPSAEVGSRVERVNRTIYNAYGQVPDRMKLGDKFGVFGKSDGQYMDAWQRWMSQVSADPASQQAASAYLDAMRSGSTVEDATAAGTAAAKGYWDAQPNNVVGRFGRHTATPPGAEGVDPHQLWGEAIMENVKGATHAPLDMGGAPHVPLLKNIADGVPTTADALSAIPDELRPVNVMGRQLLPDTTPLLDRIANVGFRKVLDPVINFISREPLYVNEAYRQYSYLKPLVDSGDMLAADARQLAQVRAVNGVLPFIHNTLERSQFSTLARNYMPFWFAQEQAYKRVGRLFADDPGAFRRFQLMISGMHEVGSTTTDPNGKSWLIYPGSGYLADKAAQLASALHIPIAGSVPVAFSGQLKSLNTVFPFSEGVRPSFGPVVAIPSHVLENLFPEINVGPLHIDVTRGVHAAIGDQAASGSVYDQLIPNQFIKSTIQALDPSMRSRSMQNAVINTLQYMAYHQEQAMDKWTAAGGSPTDPGAPRIPGASPDDSALDRQALIDKVKNQTRITFMFKALLGAVTPASPVTNVGDWNLRADLRDLIAKKGITAAIPEFLANNPGATPYTVAMSSSQAGAPLPTTNAGQAWINENLSFIRQHPNAGAWFVPQTAGQFSQGVYNEQLAQHLRTHKAPDQALNDMYIAAGNDRFYNQDLPAYKAELAKAQQVGDKNLENAVRSDFSSYITNVLGPQNPVWWDDFKSADRDHNRQLAVKQMLDIFSSGKAPASPQTADLASLVQDFQGYAGAKTMAARDPNVTAAQVKDDWQSYLTRLSVEKPNLAPVIRSVFMQL